jgi:hypothetical protein
VRSEGTRSRTVSSDAHPVYPHTGPGTRCVTSLTMAAAIVVVLYSGSRSETMVAPRVRRSDGRTGSPWR